MKKVFLLIATVFTLAARAQCPITNPNVCLPLTSLPLVGNVLSLVTGTGYCINGNTVINGRIVTALGSTVYNKGTLTAKAFVAQNPNGLVLCANSTTTLDSLTVSSVAALVAPSTTAGACIVVNNFLNVTSAAASVVGTLNICVKTGATVLNSNQLAGATISLNCSGCTTTLPVVFKSYSAKLQGNTVAVDWECGYGMNSLIVQSSEDGKLWNDENTQFGRPYGQSQVYHADIAYNTQKHIRVKAYTGGDYYYTPAMDVLPSTPAASGYYISYMDDTVAIANKTAQVYVYDGSGRAVRHFDVVSGEAIESNLQDLHGLIFVEIDGKEKSVYRP